MPASDARTRFGPGDSNRCRRSRTRGPPRGTVPAVLRRPPAAANGFAFHTQRSTDLNRQRVVTTNVCLDARLSIGRKHVIVCPQRFAVPHALIQLEDHDCLLGEVRGPGKNPRAVLPGLGRRRVENPKHRTAADRFSDLPGQPTSEVNGRLFRERQLRLTNGFAGGGFGLGNICRRKRRLTDPVAACLRGRTHPDTSISPTSARPGRTGRVRVRRAHDFVVDSQRTAMPVWLAARAVSRTSDSEQSC